MGKKIEFKVGEEVIAYLRHSTGRIGKIPFRVKIEKISNPRKNFGRLTYIVSNDVGAKFPTRVIKKLKK